ncbi:hypothetical protein PSTT_00716 [Puccinia striiformis]|uniref:Uncharacterized protein n=1 Tax=Puccinia striiformis TaxID=27350 RepID=A0A2S4W6R7_9BASI|nr:hypothetical protein PSTT_00716 [Puccinia striiformis]
MGQVGSDPHRSFSAPLWCGSGSVQFSVG